MKKDISLFVTKIFIEVWDEEAQESRMIEIHARPALQQKVLESEYLDWDLTLDSQETETDTLQFGRVIDTRRSGSIHMNLTMHGFIDKVSGIMPEGRKELNEHVSALPQASQEEKSKKIQGNVGTQALSNSPLKPWEKGKIDVDIIEIEDYYGVLTPSTPHVLDFLRNAGRNEEAIDEIEGECDIVEIEDREERQEDQETE